MSTPLGEPSLLSTRTPVWGSAGVRVPTEAIAME